MHSLDIVKEGSTLSTGSGGALESMAGCLLAVGICTGKVSSPGMHWEVIPALIPVSKWSVDYWVGVTYQHPDHYSTADMY